MIGERCRDALVRGEQRLVPRGLPRFDARAWRIVIRDRIEITRSSPPTSTPRATGWRGWVCDSRAQ